MYPNYRLSNTAYRGKRCKSGAKYWLWCTIKPEERQIKLPICANNGKGFYERHLHGRRSEHLPVTALPAGVTGFAVCAIALWLCGPQLAPSAQEKNAHDRSEEPTSEFQPPCN